ncbi:SNF2 family N-terminal domain-containing protein [Xylariaceae sp. FL0016]|nr:SNF2 family N-terminal domain-containing protein [Xylariaceae sp. FL0016]
MASPQPSSSSAAAPQLQSEEDIQDELNLQQILLESITGTEQDTPDERAKFKAEIKELRRRLERCRALAQGKGSSHISAPRMADSFDYMAPPRTDNLQEYTHPDSDIGRKRTFSTHNGQPTSFGPSKSRRTTPSPGHNTFSSSPSNVFDDAIDFIDLTGDDDLVQNQKQLWSSWDERKQQADRDAMAARQLHNQINSLGSASTSVTPSGPTAFDRIQHYTPANDYNQNVKTESASTPSDALNSPLRSRIPSHIKSEPHPPPTSSNFGQHFGSGPSSVRFEGGQTWPKMPGAFEDSDDESSVIKPEPSGSYNRNVPHSQPLYGGNGFSSASSLPGRDVSNHAGVAALHRNSRIKTEDSGKNAYGNVGGRQLSNNSMFLNQVGYGVPAGSNSSSAWNGMPHARPGFLQNGAAFGQLDSSLGFYTNTPGLHRPASSLNDIISRTGLFDFENGLDDLGNPLDPFIRSLHGDMYGTHVDEEEIKALFSNIRPDVDITEEDRNETPKELKCPLYKHQRLALAWMKRMEADDKKKGGILADDMGLGKTISSLALLVSNKPPNPPPTGQRFVKTTLIVSPVALTSQWALEIQNKVKRFSLNCFIYHQKKTTYETLRTYDVVITTYGMLSAESSKRDTFIKEATKDGGRVDNSLLMELCPLTGPNSLFFRVILDEAQCIKNPNTKMSKAAKDLKAKYRWCLTGTPMMNGPQELASLIQFLRIEPYCKIEKFRHAFNCLSVKNARGNQTEAMRKLQALLKAIMLRRTKNSELDGKPIITLPEKVEEVTHVVFSDDEEQYYRDLEKNSQVQVNKYLRQGTIGKHYGHVLILLLRLRQACCHPYLHITDVESTNHEVSEDMMVELARTLAPDVVRRIKEAEGFECPICMDAVENPSIMLPCGHDVCSACFLRLMEGATQQNIRAGQEGNTMHCPECRGDVKAQKVISYEVFRQVHMPETLPPPPAEESFDDDTGSDSDASNSNLDGGYESASDVDDKGNLKDFIVDDNEDDSRDRSNDNGNHSKHEDSFGDDIDQISDLEDLVDAVRHTTQPAIKQGKGKAKARKAKSKRKGKKKEEEVQPHMLGKLRKDAAKNKNAHAKYMRYLKKIWLPSAKLDKCCELLSDIQTTGEKTIIFSQWTLLLDLLEVPIATELKLGFRRYDGSMGPAQRVSAVRDFMEKSDVKVILISLKAGNAGLNLTAASHVIIMDPFWNPFIENQAIDRAHRIGQVRPVKVHRILVQNTVEDRIVDLQQRKRDLVESALSEQAAANIGRLTSQEIAGIFGLKAN